MWGTVPVMLAAFPFWIAILIVCSKKLVDLASPVASAILFPICLTNFRLSFPHEPNVSVATGLKVNSLSSTLSNLIQETAIINNTAPKK